MKDFGNKTISEAATDIHSIILESISEKIMDYIKDLEWIKQDVGGKTMSSIVINLVSYLVINNLLSELAHHTDKICARMRKEYDKSSHNVSYESTKELASRISKIIRDKDIKGMIYVIDEILSATIVSGDETWH